MGQNLSGTGARQTKKATASASPNQYSVNSSKRISESFDFENKGLNSNLDPNDPRNYHLNQNSVAFNSQQENSHQAPPTLMGTEFNKPRVLGKKEMVKKTSHKRHPTQTVNEKKLMNQSF